MRVSADIKKLEFFFCVSKNEFQCMDVVYCARFLNENNNKKNIIDTAEKNTLYCVEVNRKISTYTEKLFLFFSILRYHLLRFSFSL
jgi:hypothetical protein